MATPPPSTTLDYALAYIRRGWSVFPLIPRSKQPAVKIAGFLDGSDRYTEQDAFVHWGAGNPDHGIAIVTGKPSGLVVIDVDPRNGGDARAVAATMDEPTWTVRTGGGGVHYYTTAAGSFPSGKTPMPGVDRKADGGYVVAPPSIHPSGTPYEIIDPQTELILTPTWVFARPAPVSITGEGEPAGPWVSETLANPRGCKPGTQEATLARLAWWASRHLERDVAVSTLLLWAQQLPLGNKHDPWTVEHVVEKLDRAYEKRALEPGAAGPLVDDTDDAEPAADDLSLFEPVNALDFPDQQWIVEDFAAPGAFTEIIGKVKKGKSTLTYQLIDAVRRGDAFLGRATVQGGVVLLTEQTGTSLKKTLERAGLLDADNVYVLRKQQIQKLGWRRAVRLATALCRTTGIRLIVVDTLSRLASIGGDSENSSGAVAVLDPFNDAKELGVACIFVRHARKGQSGEADEIADAARGSSAITGDMDIVLRLTSVEDDIRCLSWESRITDDPEDVYLEYDDGTYLVVEKPKGRKQRQDDEDLKALRDALARGIEGRNAISKELGWGKNKTDRLLKLHETYTHGPGSLTEDAREARAGTLED
jgi:hypothetical protein